MQEIEDEAIIQRAIEGDSEAFGFIYERYVSRIYNYIYYRIGSVYEAEDLTARVFMRALHHIRNYNNRGLPFSAWLYRIAHNLVANWHRDHSRHKEISLDDGVLTTKHIDLPEHEFLKSEERERLLGVVRSLPPDRQHLIVLKFVDHLSNAEIGQVMGRTEGAIKSLYHRTLLSIRNELSEMQVSFQENDTRSLIGENKIDDADRD